MTEDLSVSTISVGGRIALTKYVCKRMKVSQGDKVVIYITDSGEFAIRSATRTLEA